MNPAASPRFFAAPGKADEPAFSLSRHHACESAARHSEAPACCACPTTSAVPLPGKPSFDDPDWCADAAAPRGCMRAWLELFHTDQLGASGIERLRLRFGGACAALAAPPEPLLEVLGPARAGRLLADDPVRQRAVQRSLEWADIPGNHLIARSDPRYPDALTMLADPPPVLFVQGHPEILSMPALALVGSRHASRDGLACARSLGTSFAEAGLVITSGLAAGIDSAAHEGALAARGLTAAVIGTGVDRIYPIANRRLARAISDNGAILSELPLGSDPLPHHFPRRNRLIAALSAATVVVQAARFSGSLITARLAAEYGREVMAFPGSVHSPLSKGCHQLIREGAALVEDATEIAALVAAALMRQGLATSATRLAQFLRPTSQRPASNARPSEPDSGLSPAAQRLLGSLGWAPEHPDQLAAATGLGSAGTGAALVELELHGRLERLLDGRYQRLGPSRPVVPDPGMPT